MKQTLPNSVAVLVLGILGLTASPFCFGIVLAILSLSLSGKPTRLYKENPDIWDGYGMVKVGRICAIISIALNILSIIFLAGLMVLGFIGSHYSFISSTMFIQ